MPYPSKPTETLPLWTDGDPAKQIEPSSGKKETGWILAEKPPFQWFNWLLYSIGLWLSYFEDTTDQLKADVTGDFNISVGSGKQYATLAEALVAAVSGDALLVFSDESVSTNIVIAQNNLRIKFRPGVTFSQSGGATICLDVTGDRVEIESARFNNFATGIRYQAGADYGRVKTCNFVNCTTPVDFVAETCTEQGSIYE